MFARTFIITLLLTQLVLQSIMPCCLCCSSSAVAAEIGWSAFLSPCECTQCPTSSDDEPSSVPADHDSKHSSCPFCSGAVVDTSQVASPYDCPFYVLPSRFDGVSHSTRSLTSATGCDRNLPSMQSKGLGVRLLI